MSKRLTAAAVERLRPGTARLEIADAGSEGLRLVIQPSGAKSWAMRFRRPDGKNAKLTLGSVDLSGREGREAPRIGQPLTLREARLVASDVHRRRASGIDVVAEHGRGARSATTPSRQWRLTSSEITRGRGPGGTWPASSGSPTPMAPSIRPSCQARSPTDGRGGRLGRSRPQTSTR